MPRPYRKQPWPYISKDGKRKSYFLGYYDHEGVKRSKVFPSVSASNAWVRDYTDAAGRTPFIGPPGVRVGGLGWVAG